MKLCFLVYAYVIINLIKIYLNIYDTIVYHPSISTIPPLEGLSFDQDNTRMCMIFLENTPPRGIAIKIALKGGYMRN